MSTATETQHEAPSNQPETGGFDSQIRDVLSRIRNIDLAALSSEASRTIPATLSLYSDSLKNVQKSAEAEALNQVREKALDRKAFGGLGLDKTTVATPTQQAEILFLVEAWLEAINSKEQARDFLSYQSSPTKGTRPMTLAQKIFAQHVVGDNPDSGLTAGDVVRVGIDWVLASELSWQVCIRPLTTFLYRH